MKALGWSDRSSGAGAAGPMTDEQKAERRTLIANNKAWALRRGRPPRVADRVPVP